MPTVTIEVPRSEAVTHQRLLDLGPHLERRGPLHTIASFTAVFPAGQHAVIALVAGEPPYVEATLIEHGREVARLPPTDGLLGEHALPYGNDVFRVLVGCESTPAPVHCRRRTRRDLDTTADVLRHFPGRTETDPDVQPTIHACTVLLDEIGSRFGDATEHLWEHFVDLVDDCMGHDAAAGANSVPDGPDGEEVIEFCFARGSEINNAGIAAQVATVLAYHGAEEGARLVRALYVPVQPSPALAPALREEA